MKLCANHVWIDSVRSLVFKCVLPCSCSAHSAPPQPLPPPFPLSYISSLALTSLVKIAIIFHPLIAHSIQQIGQHWLLLHASRFRGRVVLRLGFLITPRACSRSGESLYVLANDWHAWQWLAGLPWQPYNDTKKTNRKAKQNVSMLHSRWI